MKQKLLLGIWAGLFMALALAEAEPPEALPQTRSLDWEESDLSARLMDGAHRYIERKIQESVAKRNQFWTRDFSSPEAYARSVQPNRARFQTIIGAVDSRLPARLERFGDDSQPALVAETPRYRVYQVRWPVFEGLFGSGLLVQPKGPPAGHGIVLPDADQTPEQLMGLADGVRRESQVARRLAENGFELVLPILVDREKLQTTDKQLQNSDQTHREWIYRQAFHMGRHVIGYEVQTVLAAVDWMQHGRSVQIGVCGYAEGGLIAFYAAAVDPRIDAVLVSGYFDSRQNVWAEPIYRNVWGLLREFGDAEVASLILPRALIVEHSPAPTILGQKGEWRTPDIAGVAAELDRIELGGTFARPVLVQAERRMPIGPFSEPALAAFAKRLGREKLAALSDELPVDKRAGFDPGSRQRRLVQEMENQVQTRVLQSDKVRDQFFLYSLMPELSDRQWSTAKSHPTHSPEKFIAGAEPYRRQFWEEAMGRFDDPLSSF